jgi:hypothetical protein
MSERAEDSSLELLLADADERRPMLAEGLPEEAASLAPKPRQVPGDALVREALDANPNDLPAQRWGVIAPDGPRGDRLLQAIEPLIRLREHEQGAPAYCYRVPGDLDVTAAAKWKDRVLYDEDVPQDERPKYLLILGDLDQVSIELQQVLASGSFVGRVHCPDDDGYRAYAEKVVRWADRSTTYQESRMLFYTAHDGSRATTAALSLLVRPCLETGRKWSARRRFPRIITEMGEDSGGAGDLLAGVEGEQPSVLLSVSHGLGRPRRGWSSPERQRALQGALVMSGGELLTADELWDRAFLPGGLWFCVACFGAGTPSASSFYPWLTLLKEERAYSARVADVLASLPRSGEPPFVAALPQAALASPEGPLAVVGHVDLAWTFGFVDPDELSSSRASRILQSLRVMTSGSRVGVALAELMSAYREVNDELVSGFQMQEDARVWDRPDPSDPRKRGNAFMLRNDLRGYVLLGDPAARLPLQGSEAALIAPQPQVPPDVASATPRRDPAAMERAVLEVLAGDRTGREIAAKYGFSREDLGRWADAYKAAGLAVLKKLS